VRVKEKKKKVETKTTIYNIVLLQKKAFSCDKQIQLCVEKKYAMLKKEEGK